MQWALVNPTPEYPEYALRIWNKGEISLNPLDKKDEILTVIKEVFGLNYTLDDMPEINKKGEDKQ